jgi:hypothetical protein
MARGYQSSEGKAPAQATGNDAVSESNAKLDRIDKLKGDLRTLGFKVSLDRGKRSRLGSVVLESELSKTARAIREGNDANAKNALEEYLKTSYEVAVKNEQDIKDAWFGKSGLSRGEDKRWGARYNQALERKIAFERIKEGTGY